MNFTRGSAMSGPIGTEDDSGWLAGGIIAGADLGAFGSMGAVVLASLGGLTGYASTAPPAPHEDQIRTN